MLFNSFIFLHLFIPIFIVLYFFSKSIKVKNVVLLVASLFFYAWGEEELVIILILSSLVDFFAGKVIQSKSKSLGLAFSLIFNLSILLYFKYANFFIEILNYTIGCSIVQINIGLPIGISFYTFQTMSYAIDVYRGKIKASDNFVNFATYVCMFPQLVAGPIVRYHEIARDLTHRDHTWANARKGCERFVIGLSKKLIIANYFALIADDIFSANIGSLNFFDAWLGIIAYTFQIFFDFSAYSDMAIGLALILGFNFPENFNYPYTSKSIREFWRRWHMTLSFWFRDYLYISLGGNRVSFLRVYFNLLVVFVVTGLWHGASWNFIIWGLIHGFFIALERLFPSAIGKIPLFLKWFYTMMVVMLAWVFFRTDSLIDALDYLSIMSDFDFDNSGFYRIFYLDIKFAVMSTIAVILCFPFLYGKIVTQFKSAGVCGFVFYHVCIFCLFILCLMYLSTSSYDPFIYFRF